MSLEKLTALRNLLDAETDKVSKLFYYKKINECLESIIKEKEKIKKEKIKKEKIEEFLGKDNIVKRKYMKFTESKSDNALIYAPTQVGKTDSIFEVIECAIKNKDNIIVSCDNKTDQLDQIKKRITNKNAFENVEIITIDHKFPQKLDYYYSNDINFVGFCLDNASKIKHLNFIANHKKSFNKKLIVIHDEGDIITKDHDTEIINDSQAKSHKEWLKFIENCQKHLNLKRIFVTATPDNICTLYNLKNSDVWKLEIPQEYQGYKDIEYNVVDTEVEKILQKEIHRIKNETETQKGGEVILYCCDRKTKNGLDFLKITKDKFPDITINTYNGKGIHLYSKNENLLKQFKELKNVSTIEDFIINIPSKTLSISDFYNICQKNNEKVVLTIGYDLIRRGISFVSKNKHFPLTATTMIYTPGKTTHCVAMIQLIGRITGLARPDLKRRLYSTEKIINDYQIHCKNQTQYITEFENKNGNTNETINNMIFENKTKSNIDKPKLKIEENFKYKEENPPEYNEVEGFIDGVNLNKLKKWIKNDNSLIGKMINYIYFISDEKEFISINEFKEGVKYTKTFEKFVNNLDNGRAENSEYGKLWISENNNTKIYINPKIKIYIKTLE